MVVVVHFDHSVGLEIQRESTGLQEKSKQIESYAQLLEIVKSLGALHTELLCTLDGKMIEALQETEITYQKKRYDMRDRTETVASYGYNSLSEIGSSHHYARNSVAESDLPAFRRPTEQSNATPIRRKMMCN